MNLQQAIEQVLHEYSNDGTTLSLAALEYLNTLNCFDKRPELRFIISTAIRSKAFAHFASYGEGTEQAYAFIRHFLRHTGFHPQLAAEAFSAYAAAIGWDNRYLPITIDAAQEATETSFATAPTDMAAEPSENYGTKAPINWHNLTLPEKIKQLNATLTLDTEKSATFGATVDSPRVVNIDVTGIILTATLRRITPMGGCQLNYALYNADDTLLAVGTAGTMNTFSTDRLPIQFTIPTSALPTDPTAAPHIHLFLC